MVAEKRQSCDLCVSYLKNALSSRIRPDGDTMQQTKTFCLKKLNNEEKERVQSRNLLGMMPLGSSKSDAAIKVSKVLQEKTKRKAPSKKTLKRNLKNKMCCDYFVILFPPTLTRRKSIYLSNVINLQPVWIQWVTVAGTSFFPPSLPYHPVQYIAAAINRDTIFQSAATNGD